MTFGELNTIFSDSLQVVSYDKNTKGAGIDGKEAKKRVSSFLFPIILRVFQFSYKRRLGTSQLQWGNLIHWVP